MGVPKRSVLNYSNRLTFRHSVENNLETIKQCTSVSFKIHIWWTLIKGIFTNYSSKTTDLSNEYWLQNQAEINIIHIPEIHVCHNILRAVSDNILDEVDILHYHLHPFDYSTVIRPSLIISCSKNIQIKMYIQEINIHRLVAHVISMYIHYSIIASSPGSPLLSFYLSYVYFSKGILNKVYGSKIG